MIDKPIHFTPLSMPLGGEQAFWDGVPSEGARAGDKPQADVTQLRCHPTQTSVTAGAWALARTSPASWPVGEAASLLLHHSLGIRHSSGWIFCCIGFPHIYPDITWAGAPPASAQREFAVQKKIWKKIAFRKRCLLWKENAQMQRRRVLWALLKYLLCNILTGFHYLWFYLTTVYA